MKRRRERGSANPHWPVEACEVCGKKKVYPEIFQKGRWNYPRKKICVDCLQEQEKKRSS